MLNIVLGTLGITAAVVVLVLALEVLIPIDTSAVLVHDCTNDAECKALFMSGY
mgnify:CR=1 FL=1